MDSKNQSEQDLDWVTEDSLDTACRIEELMLAIVHGVLLRLKGESRARVNAEAIEAFLSLYRKHGRMFEFGAVTPELPKEAIEALVWAGSKLPPLQESLVRRPN